MDPLRSSRSTGCITSSCKVAGTISANHAALYSSHNNEGNTEREVAATEMTGPTAEIMTDRSKLPRHLSF